MAKQKFYTKKGKQTDIYHSYGYAKAPYAMRQQMAFNKDFLGILSQRDKDLMRGYAQRVVEEQNAFRYNHPQYKRKGGVRMQSSTLTGHFARNGVYRGR